MPKKAGKLTIYQEETTMTATLTLNELTIEQASAVLTLLDEMKNCTITPEQAREGIDLFEPDEEQTKPAAKPEPEPEPEKAPAYTIEQVRAAFTKYAKTNGKDAAKALLEKHGAAKVTELKPEDYTSVMKEVS